MKRLSDRFEEEVEELVKQGIDRELAATDPVLHELFYLPPKSRWDHIKKQDSDIGASINKAFERIEDENDTIEQGVLTSIDFNDEVKLPGLYFKQTFKIVLI